MSTKKTMCVADRRYIRAIVIPRENDATLIKFVSNKPIGFMEYTKKKRMCTINNFQLESPYQRKKIGSCLYKYVEQNLLNKCSTIKIFATPESIPFWYSQGFNYSSTFNDTYLHEIDMEKQVNS